MTRNKLADALEVLSKAGTQGPWDIKPMPGATEVQIADGNLIRALVNNIPDIIAALRAAGEVGGQGSELVESARRHPSPRALPRRRPRSNCPR